MVIGDDVLQRTWEIRICVTLEIHIEHCRNFVLQLFRKICDILGMVEIISTPLHPQSDGVVEQNTLTLISNSTG